MQDLTAQVTSSLLQFPEVTLQALGEDEITLDSVLCGKFSGGRNGLAWLACGPQLEVVNSVTGERLSAYRFSGVNEQPPTVRVVKEFSWQKRTGLLVGLEEAEGSVLCLYDLGVSRVVKAVVLPGRVTAIEPIANHGGASVRTQHLHQSLRWLFGVAAVATDVGHLLLVDLCLDDLSCNRNGIEALDLEVVTRNPVEVALRRETVTKERRRLCFQLQNPSGTAVSTLCYISRSNQLVVGFSDGYLSLWNMKTLKREHHSQLEGGRIPVYAVTFQEPENDPRNCCYLWAVQSTQESEGDVVSLHLLQLAFGDRKRLASGQVMYEGLEYCDERYSVDLTGGVFPLRGQTRNIKLISCQTVEKFPNHVDREDSVNEVISPATSVSIFSWQVKYHHEETPSTYLGVFDINRWYHAQMPDSLRLEEFLHDCPYFALWSLDTVISMTSPKLLLDILVHERSLSRGVFSFHPPMERFFHPSNYNFDGTCLLNSGVVHMTCTGFQKEALNFLKKSGPLIREAIQDTCNRRLVAGLQSPRLVDVQPSSLSQNDRDPRLRERAVGNNSILDQCGKILPRVERNLAAEKAKPYHLPPSRSREVSRPKPLSTVVNPANAGNVRTRENFLSTRAQGLATSASGVPGFTPQSFPRPSLGTTPLATPSASPGRSVPPPLQAKEPGVSSGEENSNATWTARNDRDPRLRERAVGNNSILDQCGKILPRVERNLAAEKAKPYHLPPSRSREVSRPKPLSTVVNPANAGNVRTRENFLSTVLSNIREFWEGNEQKTGLSQGHRPGATEPPAATHPLPGEELRDAFVGTPKLQKFSPKCSSLPNLADHPIPSCSAAQSPCRASTSFWASSPLRSNMPGSISRKNFSGASELNFLQTPPVAKRAQGLATSASGVPGFTPQSFPRPSLGTTPLATPSASPGRSVPPPLQAKEPGVSSGEENSNATWTARVTEDDKALSGPSSEDHHHHHHHHHGVVEDAWCESRSKTTLFALSNPEDDHAELEESSESTPGDGLEKVDVSKENSNISARSDQTTLEYHDAKSLSDFEDDVIFIAAKPAHSSTDATANFQESEKEGGSEMVEDKPFQMEQPNSSELRKKPGFVEESNAECLALPEDDKLVFKATEAGPLGTASEGETNQQESKMSSSSEEKAIPAAPNPQLSAPPETDSESVISILDSEDVVSTHSENHLEGKRVDLPKEREHEAAEVEENVPFRQEEIPVSSCLAKTEEMNVVEDSVVKAQTSEEAPETSPYSELHPLGNLQYSYGTVEQQFACDLPDDKDGECDAAEADGELFISQSNFTLVLEGEEGEGEMGDPTSVGASKPTGATTEGKPVNSLGNNPENQEQVTNSVSTVTNDQESQNIAESLPYVPEPIKVAIAENLLDVIKDTRSKEFTSEVVEQSIHETIGKKVTRFQKAKAALTAVPEEVEDDEDEYVSTPRTRTRGQLSRSLRRAKEAVSEVLEEANEEMSLPEGSIATSAASKRTRGGKSSAGDEGTGQTDADHKIKMAVSPSRSARKQKSIRLKFTENIVKGQEVQPSDLLAVPPKRGRGRKMSSSEVSENSDLGLSKSSLPQTEFKLPVTPRRSARKGAQNLLADPEPLSTQEGIHSGGKGEILDTPRRSTRRILRAKPEKMDAREQTPAQPDEELTTPRTTVRAGRRGRKRQSILEEGTGEEAFPQGPGGSPLLLEDINPSGHDETPRSLTDRITRTRSRKTAVRQKLPVEENESFLFSPPLTKLTKKCKAGEADHPVQLKDLDPDLSSQFVFSPPLLRSRRKNVSSISRIGKEPELLTKEEEDTKSIESVGKQKLKRGRTAKSKMKKSSKTTRKHDSWTPPSVEMKFISPFGSVLDRAIDRIGKICSVCKYV
ncbi:protein ELYS-like [Numenius arquata]|uniref:protein ELYS-like n=1 Tax=Numenius arquata TaxID=31919 RepID=UPI003D30BC95